MLFTVQRPLPTVQASAGRMVKTHTQPTQVYVSNTASQRSQALPTVHSWSSLEGIASCMPNTITYMLLFIWQHEER